MNNDRELMQQALVALEYHTEQTRPTDLTQRTIASLRERLAQPDQRKPLTNDRVWLEYMQLWPFRPNEEPTLAKDILRFARAIEAAHGIGENPDAA